MSQTSKIVTAIIVAGLIIAIAIIWTSKNNTSNEVGSSIPAQTLNKTLSGEVPESTEPSQPQDNNASKPVIQAELVKSFEEFLPTANWLVNRVTLDNKTVNLNVNVPAPLTLQFNTKTKKAIGFAGCNSFSGSYVSGLGPKFSFENLELGKKACALTSPENNIVKAMNNVTRADMKGSQLVLSSEDGSTELVYDQAK